MSMIYKNGYSINNEFIRHGLLKNDLEDLKECIECKNNSYARIILMYVGTQRLDFSKIASSKICELNNEMPAILHQKKYTHTCIALSHPLLPLENMV